MRWRRLLLLAVIASLAVTAALAIGILLLGDFDDTEWRVLGTTFAISVASLLALPGAQLLDQRRAVPLAWATVALAAVAFVLFEHALWTDEDSETAWKRVGTAAVFAVATTQIAALDEPAQSRRPARALVSSIFGHGRARAPPRHARHHGDVEGDRQRHLLPRPGRTRRPQRLPRRAPAFIAAPRRRAGELSRQVRPGPGGIRRSSSCQVATSPRLLRTGFAAWSATAGKSSAQSVWSELHPGRVRSIEDGASLHRRCQRESSEEHRAHNEE